MAITTLPLPLNLTIYGGATFHREFRWIPAGETPMDFTGWSGTVLIGPQNGVSVKSLSTAAEPGGLTLGDGGMIGMTIPADQTASLLNIPGLYYQLDLTAPDATVLRFMRGSVAVIVDIERGAA